jgi:hypothetical protein
MSWLRVQWCKMGYSQTIPWSILEVKTGVDASQELHSVAGNYDYIQMVIPSFKGTPTRAYMDFIIQGASDSSGADNWFQNSSFGYIDSTATYRQAGSIPSSSCLTPASATQYGTFVYPGTNNIASYIKSGETQWCRLACSVRADHLTIRCSYFVLRLYFNE